MLSPTTMHLFSLAPIKPSQWFKRPVHPNTVYLILTMCLFTAVYVISVVRLVAGGCISTTSGTGERLVLNPSFTVPAVLCLGLHIFQIPRVYMVRCLVQLWYLPGFPFTLTVGFASTLLLSLQVIGVWRAQCVRDEWRNRLGSILPSFQHLTLLILCYRRISSFYDLLISHVASLGHYPSDFFQHFMLGHSILSARVYLVTQPRKWSTHWCGG